MFGCVCICLHRGFYLQDQCVFGYILYTAYALNDLGLSGHVPIFRYPEYDLTLQSAISGLVVRHMFPCFWNNCKYECIKRVYFWSMCCFEWISPRPFRDQWTFDIGPFSHHIHPKMAMLLSPLKRMLQNSKTQNTTTWYPKHPFQSGYFS